MTRPRIPTGLLTHEAIAPATMRLHDSHGPTKGTVWWHFHDCISDQGWPVWHDTDTDSLMFTVPASAKDSDFVVYLTTGVNPRRPSKD